MRKKLQIALLVGSMGLMGGCDNFLDVNTNPNAPQTVAANLYLAPMLHWLVSTEHWDGRFTAQYTQQLTPTTVSNWDRMGYVPGSDAGGEHWRTVYWVFGQNLIDMMTLAEAERRWDILGVGYILKAWGWQVGASLHGEMIVKEAFNQTTFSFSYDPEEFVYQESLRLLDSAVVHLSRTDGAVSAAYLGRGDRIYNGDRLQWLRFAHGMRAQVLNRYTNRPSYNPAAVIAAVDLSLRSNADDALLTYPATQNDDRNFLGRSRGNFVSYRQTQFVVGLMDGTVFGANDPRISRMLSPAPDGQYRGMDPNFSEVANFPVLTQRPGNPHGYAGTGGLQQPGRYVFADQARMPAMTYAQLQFIKAEAAYHLGNRAVALTSYRQGISSHIDFVNARNQDDNQSPTQISAAEKAAFLADARVVPTNPADLTLTHIMSQKYIAQWAWAFNEQWMDMKRYRYTDVDPASGQQVYPGFTPPTNLYPDNGGQLVYRLRPRFNSEYVWNQPGLDAIGALAPDWHTKPLSVLQP
jgi:hypothetical protein